MINQSRNRVSRLTIAFISTWVFLVGCKKESTPDSEVKEDLIRPARIYTVGENFRSSIRSFPASIESNEKTDLAFRVPGQLTDLPLKAGDVVEAGDVLARLDSTDFKNALDEKVAQLNLIKTQHQQIHSLFKKKYASQAEVDSVNAQLKAAEVAERQARTNLGYTEISAPFAGIVARVNVDNYQAIQPQQTIVQLQNNLALDVLFDVPESLIKSLKRSDAYQSLCGKVSFMSQTGRSDQFDACYKEHDTVADRLTRSYPVLFNLKNPMETNLLPGMSVDFEIDLSVLESIDSAPGVLIPVESIFDVNGEQFVWQIDDTLKVFKQGVRVGEISGDMLQILDGIDVGDQIVAAGVSYLKEGQQIRPFTKERGL